MSVFTETNLKTYRAQLRGAIRRATSLKDLTPGTPMYDNVETNNNAILSNMWNGISNVLHTNRTLAENIRFPDDVVVMFNDLAELGFDQGLQFNDHGRILNSKDVPVLVKHDERMVRHTTNMAQKKRCKEQIRLFGFITNPEDKRWYEEVYLPRVVKAQPTSDEAKAKKAAKAVAANNRKQQEKKAKRQEKMTSKQLKAIQDDNLTPSALRKKYAGRWNNVRYKAFAILGTTCMCCGIKKGGLTEMGYETVATGDHVMPFANYPLLRVELMNVQVLCSACNVAKSDSDNTDWRSLDDIRKLSTDRYGFAPKDDIGVKVLLEYIGYHQTQREVAKRLGIGQATVSRVYNTFKHNLPKEEQR